MIMKKNPLEQAFRKSQAVKKYADGALVTSQTGQTPAITNVGGMGGAGLGQVMFDNLGQPVIEPVVTPTPEVNLRKPEVISPERLADPRLAYAPLISSTPDDRLVTYIGDINSRSPFYLDNELKDTDFQRRTAPSGMSYRGDLTSFQTVYDPVSGRAFLSPAQAIAAGVKNFVTSAPDLPMPSSLAGLPMSEIQKMADARTIPVEMLINQERQRDINKGMHEEYKNKAASYRSSMTPQDILSRLEQYKTKPPQTEAEWREQNALWDVYTGLFHQDKNARAIYGDKHRVDLRPVSNPYVPITGYTNKVNDYLNSLMQEASSFQRFKDMKTLVESYPEIVNVYADLDKMGAYNLTEDPFMDLPRFARDIDKNGLNAIKKYYADLAHQRKIMAYNEGFGTGADPEQDPLYKKLMERAQSKNPLEMIGMKDGGSVKGYADGALVSAQTGQIDPITSAGTGASGLGELIWEPIRGVFQEAYTAPEVNAGVTEQPEFINGIRVDRNDPTMFASFEDSSVYSPKGYVNPSGRQFSEYEPMTYTGPAPTDLTRFQTAYDPKTGRMFYSPAEALAYGVTDYVLSTPTGLPKPPSLANTSDEEIARKASRFGISPDAYMNYYRQIDAAKGDEGYIPPPVVTGYANTLDDILNAYGQNQRTLQDYAQVRDIVTENPSLDRIFTNVESMLGNQPFTGTDANFKNARMRMLQGEQERISEPYAESNMYRQMADEYAASLPFGSAANADPKYRALREAQLSVRPVVNNDRWEYVANRSQGGNPDRIIWRDPETGRGFGYEKDKGGYLLVYGPDGSPMSGAITKDSGDVIKLLDDYNMTPEKLKSFNDAMKQSAGVDMAQTGLNVEALADKSKVAEIASDKYVQDMMANYDRQQEVAKNAGFATPSELSRTTYMQNILSQQAAAKAMLGNTTTAKDGGAVMMKRGGPVDLEKEFRLADMIDLKGMGNAKKSDEPVQHLAGAGLVKKAAKKAVERMSKAESEAAGLFHPIGGGVKLKKPVSEYSFETIQDERFSPEVRRILTPEDFLNKVGVPLIGDRAAAGKKLVSVEGVPLKEQIALEGGPEFMMNFPDVWSSEKSAAVKIANQVRKAAESGKEVLGVNVVGSPTNVDFNKMVSGVLLDRLDPTQLRKKDIKAFNAEMRKSYPDFVGIEHPELKEHLMSPKMGNVRTKFVQTMNKAKYQEAGFPDTVSARVAVTEPELLDVDTGAAGFTVGKFDPERLLIENPDIGHGTYNTSLGGDYFGSLEIPMEFRSMFPDFTEARRMLDKPEASDLRSLTYQSPAIQEYNQEWLDKVMPTFEEIQKSKRYAKGGDVEIEKEFKGKSRLIPKAVIDALDKGRKLNPLEKKIAGTFAIPENQWKLGSILEELDPVYTLGRGIDTLKNVDYGAIKDLALRRYELEPDLKKRREMMGSGAEQLGEVGFGALDVAPAGVIVSSPARKGIKSLVQKFEGVPAGLSIKNVADDFSGEPQILRPPSKDKDLPRNIAYNTYEQVPFAYSKHLEGMPEKSFAEKLDFTNEANWDKDGDLLAQYLGIKSEPSQRGVGLYTPPQEGAKLEMNPQISSRTRVKTDQEKRWRNEMTPESQAEMSAMGATRGYFDVQGASPWVRPSEGGKRKYNSFHVVLDGKPTEEEMLKLGEIQDKYGFYGTSDLGKSGVFIGFNFDYGPKELKAMRKAFEGDVKDALGKRVKGIKMVKSEGDYPGFETKWTEPQGSGAVTRQLMEYLDTAKGQNPTLEQLYAQRPSDELRNIMREMNLRDIKAPEKYGVGQPRKDVLNARDIFAEYGIEGLRDALNRGEYLPAVGAVPVGMDLFKDNE